jgi:hypothetical protein
MCVIVFLTLELPQFPFPVRGQEIQTGYYVRDMFSYECTYDLIAGFSKELKYHIVEMEFSNLPSEAHNLTAILKTREEIRFFQVLGSFESPPTNSCKNGEIKVMAIVNGEWCELRLGLNKTQTFIDPVSVLGLPCGQDMHILDKNGNIYIKFLLNASEFLKTCTFSLSPQGNTKIEHMEVSTDLQVGVIDYYYSGGAAFSISNISKGNYEVIINAKVTNVHGTLNMEVTSTQDGLSIPIECYCDGNLVMTNEVIIASYALGDWKFSLMKEPFYYYMNESSFCLNFTSPKDFFLRVDPDSREEIDYLLFDTLPENFSVIKTTFMDKPCYEFTFGAKTTIGCCLGLNLKGQGWFVSPEDMEIGDIPASIREKYVIMQSSYDSEYFDTEDQLVRQWAQQLTSNETNPYVIACSIFQNVTNSLVYPSDWKSLEEKHAFNESVSQVLKYRNGVCRHFARAYAALCIRSGLPARIVLGTAFSFLNETCKKNHEWVEIYLPKCGWVTVDPTWKEFCCLSDRHAELTCWSYFENTLNVTYADYAFRIKAKDSSKHLVMHLIEYCRDLMKNEFLETEGIDVLLDKAGALATSGSTHEALLDIAQAYLIITSSMPKEASANSEATYVFFLGLAFLIVASVLSFHKTGQSLLKKDEDMQSSTAKERACRKIEYETLNELIKTRESSTTVVGSILSSASFLIMTAAFGLESNVRVIVILSAVSLEGIWLCYYEMTKKIDGLCYDFLRKLEKSLGIDVHMYLDVCRKKSQLIRARKYIWFATFVALWIIGIAYLI